MIQNSIQKSIVDIIAKEARAGGRVWLSFMINVEVSFGMKLALSDSS